MSGPRPHPWSMTLRLTVLYAAAALGILILTASLLYWGLARSLRVEDARFVLAKAQELREIATRFPGRVDMLQNEVVFESSMPRLQGYFARILDADGGVEVESGAMSGLLPPSRFPHVGVVQPIEWRSAAGPSYLLYSAPLTPTGAAVVQVGLDVSRDAEVLALQRAMLAAVVLLGALASAGAGYFVARRGLRPIGRITAAATAVSATHLDHHIGGARWPAELSELARVFDGMLDRLNDSFGRLGRFSGDLAHELRTPLASLRGEAEVALTRVRTPEQYRVVLESALEEYDRLTGLIDRLLFLARADAGAAALDRRSIDVRSEIDAACDYYAPLAEEAGIELSRGGGGTISADPVLLRRALGNLLANAIEHTQAGGRVSITADAWEGGVRLRVTDSGDGIAAEHLTRVFERFYQVPSTRPRPRAGSGLGLALVRSIAEMHGGSAALESRVGTGTAVTLVFPDATPPHITAP